LLYSKSTAIAKEITLYPFRGQRDSIAVMYETFDHTADLGLRIRAADLNTLFAEAARALFATLVENLDAVAPTQRLEITISGSDREYLLFDWLKELLYHFDAEHLLLSRFEVHIGADGLQGSSWGEPFDPQRHELAHEVKAITYHGLHVEQTPDGWLAEVIVDI
jgi:SHS2 domain-containing protein